MKIKKFLSFVLIFAIFFSLLTACGNQEDTAREEKSQPETTESATDAPINPDLVSAFGAEMIDGEKETIKTIVTGLQACYEQHLEDQDVYEFIENVEDFMSPYKDYLKEITEEIKGMYEDAKDTGDKDKMMEILSLQSQSIAYVAPESTWSNYKFFLDNGMEPVATEQDAEEAVINYINCISEFFYGGKIIK